MIQKAFVDESMGITQIKKWNRRFENGRTSVDSDPRSGRPSLTTTPENIERVRLAIEGDRQLTVRELENISDYRKLLFGGLMVDVPKIENGAQREAVRRYRDNSE